jgi:glycosyltransferase involved in cell wall biosynthesis
MLAGRSLAIFTICSNNYLPFARVFFESARQHHPEADLFLALSDRAVGIDNTYDPDWTVIEAEQLNIPGFQDFAFRYDIMEFNTAIKPFVFRHLLEDRGYELALYFDPDIEVFRPLDGVLGPLREGASFVVTPHICAPLEVAEEPHDVSIMKAGIYNLGFLGVGRVEESIRIIDWWARRLRFQCLSAQDQGIFVDQKFVDLVPAFARRCHISHDTTLNVAYWNLSQRRLAGQEGHWTVDGEPLSFFHFSGFDPRIPDKLSKFTQRFQGDMPEPLQAVVSRYAAKLLSRGYGTFPSGGYAYGRFASGTPIHPFVRRMFREWHQSWPEDPFWTYEEFLHQASSSATVGTPGFVVTNFMKFLHDNISHLNRTLDLENPEHMRELVKWYAFRAERDIALDERMSAPVVARMEQPHWEIRPRPTWSAASRADATIIGYLRTASGVGEAGRQTLQALVSANLVVEGYDVGLNVNASRDQPDCSGSLVGKVTGKVQIFHVNADQLPQVFKHIRGDLHCDAVRVSVPFWELSVLPEPWRTAFAPVDEIWAPSRFVQRALMQATEKPVIYMPVAVELPTLPEIQREHFGLPADRFLFFFAFDYLSFIKRKNPHAAVAAFKAFRRRVHSRRAGLVIKTMNGSLSPDRMQAFRAEIADDPDIFLIDQTLGRKETLGLIAATDCILSLHRSEGFGLLIAEAMLLNRPVIATDYSATTEFVTPQTGLPVDYKLVPVGEGEYPLHDGQVWADPDIAHAAWQMARVYEGAGTEFVTDMTAAAREHVLRRHSRRRVGELQARRLNRLLR